MVFCRVAHAEFARIWVSYNLNSPFISPDQWWPNKLKKHQRKRNKDNKTCFMVLRRIVFYEVLLQYKQRNNKSMYRYIIMFVYDFYWQILLTLWYTVNYCISNNLNIFSQEIIWPSIHLILYTRSDLYMFTKEFEF